MGTHITGIKTELEASTRFMKDFMDYVKELPTIHKAVAKFQEEEIDFLKNKLNLTQQINQAQQQGAHASHAGTTASGQPVSTGPGGAVNVNTTAQQQQRQQQQNQTQQSQSPAAIPVGGGTPAIPGGTTPPVTPPAPGVMSGLPVSDRMQSLLDYRARLGSQITDPRILFEHMRQRGFVNEGVEGNQPIYTVQVGNKRVSAEDLMNSPALQSQALDHLAQQTLPGGNENGSFLRQGRALTGVASNLIRSLGPGTSVTENVAGVGEAASKIGAMGSLGGVAEALGTVALPVGIAAGALGLVEAGGGVYQGVKNLGQTHNQGFGGGFGYEMGMRMMALNPFITTEQSRQIMMGALNLGYTGKEFDTVTQFMADNLTSMNMAQPLDEPVLTPTGWVKMGELNIGDDVIGGDGIPTRVRAIHERGPLEVFEVKFSDGSSTRSSADHLWLVYTGKAKESPLRLKRLHQIIKGRKYNGKEAGGLVDSQGYCRYKIPLVQPIQFDEQNLPLDPYLLGLFLGDGSFGAGKYRNIRLTCSEKEEGYDFTLPVGVVAERKNNEYIFPRDTHYYSPNDRNPLADIIEQLGLMHVRAYNKFIPQQYLLGSLQQREAILQGLIDTDGHIDKNGIVFFTNSSKQLIADMEVLITSLGGKTSVQWIDPKTTTHLDQKITSKVPCARMIIQLPPGIKPARMPRKISRYIERRRPERANTKGIVSITPLGIEKCRCITVESPDGLYVTKGFTVTHNSVADSVKLLNTNVVQGGASIQALGQQIQGLQTLSGTSTSTNTQLQQAFEAYSKNLVSQGVSGNIAGAVALNWAGWNQNKINGQPNPLAGTTSQTLNALTSSPAFLQQLGLQYAPGVEYPGVLAAISSQPGGASNLPQDVQTQLVQIAQRFNTGNRQNDISNFMMYMNALGAGWSEQQATQWYNELTGPASQLPYQQAQKSAAANEQTTTNAHPYVEGAPNQLQPVDDNTTSIQTPAMLNNQVPNPYRGLATFPEEGKYSNPEITSLFQKYGYTNIVVYDPQGKSQPLDFSNKDMMYGLANGSWKIAVKDNSGKTSSPASIDDWRTGLVTPGGTVSSGSSSTPGAGTTSATSGGTFGLTPAASQLLYLLPGGGTVGTGANTQAANSGTNGVTPNSTTTVYPSH